MRTGIVIFYRLSLCTVLRARKTNMCTSARDIERKVGLALISCFARSMVRAEIAEMI